MQPRKLKSLKNLVSLLIFISILGGLISAQSRKREQGPRALGVLEITPTGRARLVPISILVNGKWFDAGLYMATPAPMALEPQTVYEGEKAGLSQGLFTVTGAQDMNGQWIGVGVWKPKPKESELAPKDVQVGKPAAKPPSEDDDERPVLRRPAASASPGAPPPSAPQAPTAPAPAAQPAGTAQPGAAPAKPDSKTETAQASPAEAPEDPNRPVLRRGKPTEEQADKIPVPASPKAKPAPGTAPSAAGTPAAAKNSGDSPPVLIATLPAISDAGGPEPRPYSMELKPLERQGYERTMMQLASEAIRKFAVTHPIRGKQVPNVDLTDIQMPSFDVNTSNEPVLVFSARAVESPGPSQGKSAARPSASRPPARGAKQPATPAQPSAPPPESAGGFQYYVTVVARVDVNGDVRKLFDSVTDSSHLDAFPRLQLIDCVDANGDQAGELLFRQLYDRSRSYVIYRVGMDRLWELFEGAQSSYTAGN